MALWQKIYNIAKKKQIVEPLIMVCTQKKARGVLAPVKKSTQKIILGTLFFAGFITIALTLDNLDILFPVHNSFLSRLGFALSICIYIGLYSFWTIRIYKRLMQRHVRNYFMLVGASIIFWVTIRAIKWAAFEFVVFEDRMLWYMYYIPMIMLSVFFLFISLYVGENEAYQPSKKWNLLYIPAALLIFAVLTNDVHGLAFDIDTSEHAYGQDYSHGPVYYLVLLFILTMVLVATFIILRKFSVSRSARKKALMPAFVIIVTLIYCILYIITPNYGIGNVLDLTVFGCTMAIALLEAFIRTGLIHSNMGHRECFAMADIRAQILNDNGDVVYLSENALPLAKAEFARLKKKHTLAFDSATLAHIAPINGGYVVWNSDVSQVRELIRNLKALNENLYNEIDLLTLENEQKSERARLRKLNEFHRVMLKEILPLSEKIKLEIESNKPTEEEALKRLLFETSMASIYIKRKINLILTQNAEKRVCVEDMRYCFLESFQLLGLYDKTCAIHISENCDISLPAAMASFDLYQTIIESTKYHFDTVYVTYHFEADQMVFAVQISGDIHLCYNDIKTGKTDVQKGEIEFLDETDSYYIALKIAK